MNIEKLPQSCKPKPVVGEKRDGSLTLRFDGDVDFDRVKRREDFIPHAISKTARWNAKQGSVGKINLLELTGISQIDSIQDLEPQAKSDLKLEEISFAGTVTLGGGEEAASLTFWSIVGSPEIPRIGLYTFSPVAKRNVVAAFQRDPKRVERFLKTFSRLEKHFGVARLQESFYLESENQSREVISRMESIVHQEFPQSLTLPQFAALGIEIFGSWKSVLGIGCGMVKTSQLPLVAKDTKRPLEVFYGYSMNSSGRYVRYREIQLKTFSPNDSRASFAQTTWLMRSEAIEPFEMREDR